MIVGDSHQAELSQTKGLVNRIESLRTIPTFGHVSRLPPLLRFTHALKTTESSPERRIVERASELKRLFEETILLIVHTKRKFDNVGRGGGAHKAMLLHDRKLCAPYLPLISGPPTLVKQDVKVSSPLAMRERECALAVAAGRTYLSELARVNSENEARPGTQENDGKKRP